MTAERSAARDELQQQRKAAEAGQDAARAEMQRLRNSNAKLTADLDASSKEHATAVAQREAVESAAAAAAANHKKSAEAAAAAAAAKDQEAACQEQQAAEKTDHLKAQLRSSQAATAQLLIRAGAAESDAALLRARFKASGA